MIRRQSLTLAVLFAALATTSTSALAAIDLRITEVWAGSDGSDLTPDWVEIKNFGDTAWVSGPSVLTINDSGGGLGTDAVVQGISDILPNEVAIVLMEGSTALAQSFYDIWNPVKPQVLANIGYADGSGLGLSQGGDGANIWIDDVLEDTYTYSSAPSDISIDVFLGQNSTVGNASGAVATLVVNDLGSPMIGSPGMVAPEPASALLVAIGALGFFSGCRRR